MARKPNPALANIARFKANIAARDKNRLAVRPQAGPDPFANIGELGAGALRVGKNVADYAVRSSPQKVGSDAVRMAKNVYDAVAADPVKFGFESLVDAPVQLVNFVQARDDAKNLRAAGNPAAAKKLEEQAATMLLMAIPVVGAVGKAAGKVEKTTAKGTRLTVKAAEEAAPLAVKKAETIAAPAILKSGSGAGRNLAADVLAAAGSKIPKGSPSFSEWRNANEGNLGNMFDYSRLGDVPNVPQIQMERAVPPRGPSARIVDALADPSVVQGLNETVARGVEQGGPEWYNTDPLRERMSRVVGEGETPERYAQLMDIISATSPRSRVPDNIRTGSYFNYLKSQGLPTPDKPAPGYGSVAQNLHVQNVRNLEDTGGWNIFQNPKPASFSTNLQGNQQNVTVDTHNFRMPGILAQDPRFLATSIKTGAGKDAEVLRPQQWHKEGSLSMEDAVNRPAYWTAMPNPNEYGYYEKFQQEQAKKMGLSPAQYQASMWVGGGEDTGLASTAEPFLKTFEARVKYTADRLNLSPEVVLEQMLAGKIPLLAEGGRVDKSELAEKYGC